MRRELGAGGIIFRKTGETVEFFFIKHGKGRWTFPKGHQNLGESLIETAIREIKEETGLSGLFFRGPIGKTSFRFRTQEALVEKTVQFFLFEAPADAKEVLTGEEAIWEAIWTPQSRALELCGYRNLSVLLKRAMRMVHGNI